MLNALEKPLTLAITFKPLKIKLLYFICLFLMTGPFIGTVIFYLVTLTLKFDLLL